MRNDVSIVIADDHPIFRAGLRALIQSERGFALTSEAVDGEQAISVAKKLKPDILLLDLAMPKTSGLEVLRQLSVLSLPTRCILLTAQIDDTQITDALKFGARGVILKDSATQLLIKSIHCVVAGE